MLPADASEPPAEAVLATLPFAEGPRTRVMVDLAEPGGRPFVLMLDTGAAGSVITPRLARSLGVSVRRAKSTPYRRSTRLGRDLSFWIDTNSSDTSSKTGWEYGLLGGEFLDDYVLEIDYPRRRLRFLDPKKYEVPASTDVPGEAIAPVKRSGTRFFTEVEIDGRATWVLLDTGAPGTIDLSGRSARKIGIDVDSLADYGRVGGVLGTTEARFLETQSLRWAGFEFGAVPVLVLPRGFYNQGGNTDSLLGYDLMRQFTLRIDYKRKRVWLRRGTDHRVTFYGADYQVSKQLGAQIAEVQNGFQVWALEPGGRAASIGLRNDDVIVPLYGERLTEKQILERVLSGEELIVARRDGDVWIDVSLPEPVYNDESTAVGADAED